MRKRCRSRDTLTYLQARADHNEQIHFLTIRKQAPVEGIIECLSEECNVRFEDRLVLPRIDVVLFFILVFVISAVAAVPARAGRGAVREFALLACWLAVACCGGICDSCAKWT